MRRPPATSNVSPSINEVKVTTSPSAAGAVVVAVVGGADRDVVYRRGDLAGDAPPPVGAIPTRTCRALLGRRRSDVAPLPKLRVHRWPEGGGCCAQGNRLLPPFEDRRTGIRARRLLAACRRPPRALVRPRVARRVPLVAACTEVAATRLSREAYPRWPERPV
jgi:hypothetical protein